MSGNCLGPVRGKARPVGRGFAQGMRKSGCLPPGRISTRPLSRRKSVVRWRAFAEIRRHRFRSPGFDAFFRPAGRCRAGSPQAVPAVSVCGAVALRLPPGAAMPARPAQSAESVALHSAETARAPQESNQYST